MAKCREEGRKGRDMMGNEKDPRSSGGRDAIGMERTRHPGTQAWGTHVGKMNPHYIWL